MKNENYTPKFVGETRDIIKYSDGRVVDSGWSKNTMLNSFVPFVTARLKSNTPACINYWAIGSGDEGWSSPPPDPSVDQVNGCINEIYRKAIPAENIKFIDYSGVESVSPTNILEITLEFGNDEAIGMWREFSIIGGGTDVADSGYAINSKRHGALDKTDTMTVERKIRFTFV